MPRLLFDPTLCQPPSNAPHHLAGVELLPGQNLLTEEEVARLRADRVAGFYLEWGAVTIEPVEVAEPPPAAPPQPASPPPEPTDSDPPFTPKRTRAKAKNT